MLSLRLSQKLFLAFTMVIVVVVSLVIWNLIATERLAAQNRTIVQEALPAVRLEVMLRDSASALRRLEARYAVLRDRAYLALFDERARAMAADFLRLETLLSTRDEREALRQAVDRLSEYQSLVESGRVLSQQGGRSADRLDAALEQLYSKSETELRRRQEAAQALNEQARFIGVLSLIASVLVGCLISAFAALRIARPLRQLRKATQEVAEREFYQPIPVRGRDEVADLTQAFNQMATKLRELDDLKEQFFSSISHELRTPLTAINMAANMLHEGLPGPLTPKQARLVEITQVSSNRLLRLVNQILDLGSLKAGKLRLDLRQTDLRRVVQTAVEEVRPLAEDGKLQIEVSIPENIPKIMADEERLTQVLLNLLGNSVKFTRSGGTITVDVQIEAGQAVVKVTDTGVGIAPDLVPKIFDRYEQVHKGRGGTGIGLALVKGFVEAHGGKVWVESEEGRGSCFAFSIPVEGRS